MRRLLFVSAPFGVFFAELAAELERNGCEVWRACFEGGDISETPKKNRIVVREFKEGWSDAISKILRTKNIDGVVCFNDVLPRNRIALDVAKSLHISRYVLENGYLRPHWVTLERNGVNGFSGLPRDRQFYLQHGERISDEHCSSIPPRAFPSLMRNHVVNTVRHFANALAVYPFYKFDAGYYGDSVWRQMTGYMQEYAWRMTHSERKIEERIRVAKVVEGRQVFTVLMQKPGDGQLVVHSRYGGNSGFLRHVISSFAKSAPKTAFLIVKQHPYDYGTERSPRYARSLFEEFGIVDRATYLRKTSMDICLDHSTGLVTVNSTGGLQAIQKGLAVKCMGEAVYDVDGLTFQGELDCFWANGTPAEPEVLEAYIDYLIHSSQLNGGFHTKEAREILVPRLTARLLQDSLLPHQKNVVEHESESVPVLHPVFAPGL